MAETKPATTTAETAPDPEEDDLDDLDDVLDEFQPKTTSPPGASAPSAPTSSGPGRPPSGSGSGPSFPKADPDDRVINPGEEDLEKQLAAGMKGLAEELDANPEMQKQFETMMQELIAAGAAPSDKEAGQHLAEAARAVSPETEAKPAKGSTAKAGAGKEDAFGETIKRTMERMQASDSSAKASASAPGKEQTEEEMLAQMMKELGAGGGAGGEGGEEDFNKMLMSMMSQLTNKEILYEPMKELHDKFPGWMEKNAEKQGKEDLERFKEQQRLVGEITARFERKGYSDDNEGDREYIVERMQKVRARLRAPSPPSLPFLPFREFPLLTQVLDASPRLATPRPRRRYECCARGIGGDGSGVSDAIMLARFIAHVSCA